MVKWLPLLAVLSHWQWLSGGDGSVLVYILVKNISTDSSGEQQPHLCWRRKCDNSAGRVLGWALMNGKWRLESCPRTPTKHNLLPGWAVGIDWCHRQWLQAIYHSCDLSRLIKNCTLHYDHVFSSLLSMVSCTAVTGAKELGHLLGNRRNIWEINLSIDKPGHTYRINLKYFILWELFSNPSRLMML